MNSFLAAISVVPNNIYYDMSKGIGRKLSTMAQTYVMAYVYKEQAPKLDMHMLIASAICTQQKKMGKKLGDDSCIKLPMAIARFGSEEKFQEGIFSQPERDFLRLLDRRDLCDKTSLIILARILNRCLAEKIPVDYVSLYYDLLNWNAEIKLKWENQFAKSILYNN